MATYIETMMFDLNRDIATLESYVVERLPTYLNKKTYVAYKRVLDRILNNMEKRNTTLGADIGKLQRDILRIETGTTNHTH